VRETDERDAVRAPTRERPRAIEVTPNGAQGDRSTHAAPVFAPLIEAIDWSRPAFELTEGVAFSSSQHQGTS